MLSLHPGLVLCAVIALGTLACDDKKSDNSDGSVCTEIRSQIPTQIDRSFDILLVVDNSPSMADESAVLRANLQRFANVLENIEGGLPNIHVGVVASTGAASTLGQFESQAQGSCAAPSGAFLIDNAFANGEREYNYSGSLGDTLECMAALPATGLRIEQPLEAMRAALNGTHSGNAGFLREDAFLFVLMLGDEDDCSGGNALGSGDSETNSAWQCFADAVQCEQSVNSLGTKTGCTAMDVPVTLTPVASYVESLRNLKEDPGAVMVSALGTIDDPIVIDATPGPGLSSACSPPRSATPSLRLDAFLSEFPNRNSGHDVCTEDWSDAISILADLLARVLGNSCIDGNIDLEPNTPGVQSDCVVSQVQFPGTDQQSEQLLSECSSANPDEAEKPCWHVIEDSQQCPGPALSQLTVIRGRETLPAGIVIDIHCHGGCVPR